MAPNQVHGAFIEVAHGVDHHRGRAHPRARHSRSWPSRGTSPSAATGSASSPAPGSPRSWKPPAREHIPLPAEADFDDRQDLGEIFPERAGLKGAKAIAFDIEHVFVRPGRAQHDAIMAAHARRACRRAADRPRLRRAAPSCSATRSASGRRSSSAVSSRCTIASRDTAPYGMGLTPLRGPLGRLRNALLSALAARTVFPRAERLARRGQPRAARHGRCRSRSSTGPGTPRRSCSSPSPSSSTPAPTPRRPCTSPVRSRPPAPQAPLPPWWDDLDGSTARRPRHPGHDRQPRLPADHRPDARGARRGRRCSWSCPPADAPSTRSRRCPRTPAPPTYLPYDELLPRTDVYVTNGGYGGVQYALRYGVPIVTSSGQEDKPEVAAPDRLVRRRPPPQERDPDTGGRRRRGALRARRPDVPGQG